MLTLGWEPAGIIGTLRLVAYAIACVFHPHIVQVVVVRALRLSEQYVSMSWPLSTKARWQTSQ